MKRLIALSLSIFITISLFSQDMSLVFQTKSATWYGLDFSEAYFVGSEGFTNPMDIKDRYFNSWNMLIKNEYDKYNIGKAFKKSDVEFSLDIVSSRNQEVDIYDRVVDDGSKTLHLDDNSVQEIIGEYETAGDESGLGIVFVVESFSKTAEVGSFYVTLFEIDSKRVLITERIQGKIGGFGIRNYWAKSVYNTLKVVPKKYKNWENKYK